MALWSAKPLSSGFPQAARIKKPREFQRVFQGGAKTVGRFFVVFARRRDKARARLGLAVGRKVGNAVVRNRIKRLVREGFRHEQDRLQGLEVVVVARGSAARGTSGQLTDDLAACWRKISHDQ
ncbi:MAG: ribonuclease P protein component [Thiohalorhabdus sp.]|uniref:ribonuclease P protein component n=1 Tax=Thiohalorhabdus sp. TaxID=3094134 RepID=UPI00397EF2C0